MVCKMMMIVSMLLLCFFSSTFASESATTLHEWTTLAYDWDAFNITKDEAIDKGYFQPSNNAPTGIKVYKDDIFIAVSRWRAGVPSTLNKIIKNGMGESVLQPYPNQWFNNLSNPNGIKYVQSMEIDNEGRMWILDVGRSNIFAEDPSDIVNGSAKIVLWDIESGMELDRFILPDDVAPPDGNFLNDIVVDVANMICYVSDSLMGTIVIVDMVKKRASLFEDVSTKSNPTVDFVISGVDYGTTQFTTPEDGIALTPDKQWVYYCPLQDLTLYRVPTSLLSAWPYDNVAAQAGIEIVGTKTSPADGMTFTSGAVLYSGGITDPDNSVWYYNMSAGDAFNQTSLADNVYWADTFAFDGKGNLLFTENHLNLYFTYTMDFSETAPSNFFVKYVYVGEASYI